MQPGLFDVARGVLLGSKCTTCGVTHFPPKSACPDCHGADVAAVPLPTHGQVRTFSVVRAAPSRFEQPYVIAFVALANTDLQVFAPLKGIAVNKVHIGMDVRVSIEALRQDADGTDVIAYCFRPPNNAEGEAA